MTGNRWRTAPLWSLASEKRTTVEPADLGDRVVHYSIPAIDAIGTGRVESTADIKSAKLRLHGGEVLVSKLNPRKSRVVTVQASALPVVSSTEFVGLRPEKDLDAGFLAYFLQSEATRQTLDSRVQSVTRSHQRAAPEDVTHLMVTVPPLEEQHRITAYLNDTTARIDGLTHARQSQLRCLSDLWQSKLAEMTEGLISTHGVVALRRVVMSVEQGWSPQCEETEADPSEWAVLKTSAVSTGTFQPQQHKRLPPDITPDLRYKVVDGDILMTRGSGSAAHVGVATLARTDGRKLLLSDLLYRLRVTNDWDPRFVTMLLGSAPVRAHMALLLRGQSGQTIKLRADDIKSVEIPATPADSQLAVVAELEASRQSISGVQSAIRRSLALFRERRQALITAAVTGQFDVSTASGRNVTEGVSA
ncbi:restriction endonuclease subunit S [Streptomyces sp. B3I8]|uniref:restriction endonuclease subunit S n=1 Tax=Streptomyces sp. B3I8 TaxID=3042303 RepID=UPI002787B8DB|nr:restriction endonuclease subunit S [Streptomyces sp. B3I8]MDQ0790423.1 type I restriction enzyme S subunit [Streptomyces sp. B3I8]